MSTDAECQSADDFLDALPEDETLDDVSDSSSGTTQYAFVVGAEQGDRLDKYLMSVLPEGSVSREKVKAAIREGRCHLDGAPCNEPKTKVQIGQIVHLCFVNESPSLVPHALLLPYIYKDDALTVVNKPHGLTVHPCPSCDEVTLVHGLVNDFPQLAALPGLRPGIVHRLDKDTSGIMVVALREDIRLRLSAAFSDRRVQKTYLAVVCGVPAVSGVCREPIGRHPSQKIKMAVKRSGREAHTEWTRLYADPQGQFSVLAVTIHTGRTHQIRVHMTHIGHPLVGDSLYTLPKWRSVQLRADRQMLHAWKLSFDHPETGELLSFVQPIPDDMRLTLLQLARATVKVVVTGCPGCGKSTVLRSFAEQGIPVFSADDAVCELYQAGQSGQIAIARFLGKACMDSQTGNVDRRALFAAMRDDDRCRERVNRIIHPLVYDKLVHFFASAEKSGHRFAVAEVPLWSESRQSFDTVDALYCLGVSCREDVRHQRLNSKRGWTTDTIASMDCWQQPESIKLSRSHWGIDNSGTQDDLLSQLADIKNKFEALYAERNKALCALLKEIS